MKTYYTPVPYILSIQKFLLQSHVHLPGILSGITAKIKSPRKPVGL